MVSNRSCGRIGGFIHFSASNVLCPKYLVQLVFPNNVLYEGTVIEVPLQGQSVQCLIGRYVLSHAVFVYIGYQNLFSLSF